MSSLSKEYDDYFRGQPLKGYTLPVEKLIFAELDQYPHQSVLDLGCGVGNNIKYLSDKWPLSLFVGVDISPVAIEYARSKSPNSVFSCSEIEEIEFSRKFDIIFLIGVLEHVFDMAPVFEKIKSLSNGIIFVRTVFNKERNQDFSRPGFGDNQAEWNIPEDGWETIFKRYGFDIVKRVTGIGLLKGRDLAWILERRKDEKSGKI